MVLNRMQSFNLCLDMEYTTETAEETHRSAISGEAALQSADDVGVASRCHDERQE